MLFGIDDLKNILAQKGVKQSQLAKHIKVTPQYIGQIINKERVASREVLEQIEAALNLHPGALVSPRDYSAPPKQLVSLRRMKGVEIAHLQVAMKALIESRNFLIRQKIEDVTASTRGKVDTLFFDLAPEHIIVQRLREFDNQCAIFTEEGTTEERREFAARLAFFIDPFDRSKPFAKALDDFKKTEPDKKYVADAINDPNWSLQGLDAPFASITCVRDSKMCFNVMCNYTSGEIYVACAAMIKYGPVEKCPNPEAMAEYGKDIVFARRDGTNLITFVGTPDKKNAEGNEDKKRKLYEDHLTNLGFGLQDLPPPKYQDPGGPARILYLSDMPQSQGAKSSICPYRPAFILSNGEKICEWAGWLAYAAHSESLRAYELIAEKVSARDFILLAPPPTYSLFSIDANSCKLKLERVTGLDRPVTFRSAIVVTHFESSDVAIRMKARKEERCRELRLFSNS